MAQYASLHLVDTLSPGLPSPLNLGTGGHHRIAMAPAAARLLPAAMPTTPHRPLNWCRSAAARRPSPSMRLLRSNSRLLVVASAQSNLSKAVQKTWRVSKEAVDAGSALVPDSVPRPIARIGVTFVAVSVALFLLKSVISTALFVLAMMGLIYFAFLAMNPKEGSRSMDEGDSPSSDDPAEEARRIMEKYK
ncbi:uncharacterized protein LOC119332023 [Triticum dicoccoides]|uniref:Uncharacterized protein n=1 Tax=Triticum turgidum subsp. durum TaxID=4567 RepID=A0A9R0ZN61_TRITD|nr:uncharacterized protein LOC119332023 [Triticum dicoccoides]VAI79880.1 unnamed protein product [Triticum turgidum subsp. durum]